MAEIMKDVISFKGKLSFDTSRPDGVPRKLTDISRLSNMGWHSKINLREGLEKTYKWYVKNVAE